MMLLTGGNRYAAQELWLRKARIHTEQPSPSCAGASAPKAAQQVAGRRPRPAPARAQAVSKPRTAAQIARHERSQKQLRQKHLARKMWASVRIASRLLAWWSRAGALRPIHGLHGLCRNMRGVALDEFVELTSKPAPCKCTEREAAEVIYQGGGRLPRAVRRGPILVGRLLLQQWPSERARRPHPAALPALPTSSAVAAQPPPALALAAPPPPALALAVLSGSGL